MPGDRFYSQDIPFEKKYPQEYPKWTETFPNPQWVEDFENKMVIIGGKLLPVPETEFSRKQTWHLQLEDSSWVGLDWHKGNYSPKDLWEKRNGYYHVTGRLHRIKTSTQDSLWLGELEKMEVFF